ncbi:MAG: hypothetical protein U1F36_00905 [Planctomycetota bacterium]
MSRTGLALLCLVLCALRAPAQQQDHIETWPDGSVRERYAVDAQGNRSGVYESFDESGKPVWRGSYRAGRKQGTWLMLAPNGQVVERSNWRDDQRDGTQELCHEDGKRKELTTWKAGVLEGPFEELDETGQWKRAGSYRKGLLHGDLKITQARKPLSKQSWADGQLIKLDGIVDPFPLREDALRSKLETVLGPAPDDTLDHEAERLAALRRLQAFRALCRLPYEEMSLEPRWNELCDAGAALCAHIGHLDHTPKRPDDFDEERYKLAYEGTSHSNLSVGPSMIYSVDNYMDDSDPSNIDRIGHRRWCLNPVMKKTGFGSSGSFSAMWSMDGSGKGTREIDAVMYPPPGWVPVDFFRAHIAWSIAPLKGGTPKKDDLRVRIRALDENFLPQGEPLAIDYLNVAGGGYGSGPCIVFKPVGLICEPDKVWLCEVSTDGGKSDEWRYVVAFCAPIGAGRR